MLKITDGVMRHMAVRRVGRRLDPPARACSSRASSGGRCASQDSETEMTETETESA